MATISSASLAAVDGSQTGLFIFRRFVFKKRTGNEKSTLKLPGPEERRTSKVDKQALQSALFVRSLIVGTTTASQVSTAPQLNRVKSQLIAPKSANKVISALRILPISEEPFDVSSLPSAGAKPCGPIRAVCLEHSDAEEERLHFSKLSPADRTRGFSAQGVSDVMSAPLHQLTELFNEMHVVDLIKAPDFGLGQPGSGAGILSGAVPTAETVLSGIQQITPELMALGYATGKAILPDHTGIYPPTDRISIMTYWWGLELLLPPPTLKYLNSAQSISGAVINFLTALSLINNGVREILPFIRYISQFVDFEFDAIKRQDKGRGVVCAATWIMPAAMVPRPWDFPVKPAVDDGTLTVSKGSMGPSLTPQPATISIPQVSIASAVAATAPA